MYKKYTVFAATMSFCVSSLCASDALQIQPSSLVSTQHLGDTELYHDATGFYGMRNGQRKDIQNCFVDPQLRNMSSDTMKKYLAVAKLSVTQVDGDELAVRTHVPGPGGDPILCVAVYVAVKALTTTTAVATGAGVGKTLAAAFGGLVMGASFKGILESLHRNRW